MNQLDKNGNVISAKLTKKDAITIAIVFLIIVLGTFYLNNPNSASITFGIIGLIIWQILSKAAYGFIIAYITNFIISLYSTHLLNLAKINNSPPETIEEIKENASNQKSHVFKASIILGIIYGIISIFTP